MEDFSVKIKNFKCFRESEQGFDRLKPINLLIGKNNSGKSSLIDLIEATIKGGGKFSKIQWNGDSEPEIILESKLTESEINNAIPANTSSGPIPGNHRAYGKTLIGKKLRWKLNNDGSPHFIFLTPDDSQPPLESLPEYREGVARVKNNPLRNRVFKKIVAERDIVPEPDNSSLSLQSNGVGATNIIQNFINKASLPSDLVESILFRELNSIFNPDGHFSDILCQQIDSGKWEIHLKEDVKGRVPLSESGSGLKTIILVLIYINLLPSIEKRPLRNFVFAFEELENNLHPALHRRLLNYIYKTYEQHDCIFFLTTHSSVAIDYFNKNENAQILHLTHDGNLASCRTVKTYIENQGILDDLDIRASDLLQSNCIIWVEGPSDRIYINRWIQIWSNEELIEGTHYQCVFYGGRLLSHLSAEDPDYVAESVSILNVNRNSIVLIDSDKQNRQTPLNLTKQRIIKEMGQMSGFAWVTRGKEIENYIPADTLKDMYSLDNVDQVGQYDDFFAYLDTVASGDGTRYANKKTMFAEKICPHFRREHLEHLLDLSQKLDAICRKIQSWNQ